jgi:hypothetical protein
MSLALARVVPRQAWGAGCRLAAAGSLAWAVAGCASQALTDEPVADHCAPIVGGAPDPDHSGVVALLGPDGSLVCSGTLIRAEPEPVVLTAAHCVSDLITFAAVGPDYRGDERLTYETTVFRLHPDFDRRTGEFDFAVVTLAGAVDPAWVVPVMAPSEDELGPDTPVRFVGYGTTEGLSANSLRNEVDGTITSLSATTFDYQQDTGGPCAGDSGGPALVYVGDQPLVAGVTSYGDGQGCWSRGVSARVSAAADFLARYRSGLCPPTKKEPS